MERAWMHNHQEDLIHNSEQWVVLPDLVCSILSHLFTRRPLLCGMMVRIWKVTVVTFR
jgi:hypothetical protein